jgi:uncharacterized membrane protein
MEQSLEVPIGYLIAFVELCGAFVILVGVVRAILGYIQCFIFKAHCQEDVATLRLHLGQSMVIALEFQVAADILKTGVSPSWTDLLQLAATIALRTLLNYLLERELEHLKPVSIAD